MLKFVMKRLLDTSSPINDAKKKCFENMADYDKSVSTIMELLLEMGLTVEETKNMILNHCVDLILLDNSLITHYYIFTFN